MGRLLKGCAIGCVAFILLAVVLGFVARQWFQQTFGGAPPTPPKIGGSVALRPVITLKNGRTFAAGTAVAVRLKPDGKPVLLTALHLFGPAGGELDKETPPAEMDRVVKGLALTPLGGKKPVAFAKGSLRKSGAGVSDENTDVSGDVAAFTLLPNARVNALPLAGERPRMGEWLWLIGDEVEHKPQTQRLYPVKVVQVDEKSGKLYFKTPVELQGFSGAPLINSRREVVGLLIAGGGPVGFFNPAESIRKRLSESGVAGAAP